jgi:glutaredoxin 3|tara:strand:+ start:1572 stop:1820 length:249 start_codon:yes stop_codon:yes gene_type:complete
MIKATVWTKDDCLYCSLAKKELHSRKYKIDERNITSLWSKEDLLKVVPKARTVPQIFINDKYIGGYNELMQYFEETTSNYGH